MNKSIFAVLVTGSLLLLQAPDAAAHKGAAPVTPPPVYYRYESPRAKHMPRWLHRNKAFRSWYHRSHLKRNRYITWHRLYDAWYREEVIAKRYRHDHHHDRRHYRR